MLKLTTNAISFPLHFRNLREHLSDSYVWSPFPFSKYSLDHLTVYLPVRFLLSDFHFHCLKSLLLFIYLLINSFPCLFSLCFSLVHLACPPFLSPAVLSSFCPYFFRRLVFSVHFLSIPFFFLSPFSSHNLFFSFMSSVHLPTSICRFLFVCWPVYPFVFLRISHLFYLSPVF